MCEDETVWHVEVKWVTGGNGFHKVIRIDLEGSCVPSSDEA